MMTKGLKVLTAGALLVGSAGMTAAAAAADPIADFYRSKTYNIYTGTGENSTGAVVQYTRAVSQFIGRHIPGEPTVVMRSMPGAGGIKAANYIYNIAPQDGTVHGFISRGFIIQPLMGTPQAQFDPTKFQWIGSTASEVSVGAIWTAGTDVRTIQDAMKKEIVVGGTAPGQDTGLFPVVLNRLIGTKFKVVTGYASSSEVDLAMQRGEAQGKIGWSWGNLNAGNTVDWVSTGKVHVIIQMGLEKSPKIPSDVPLLLDLARNDEDRRLMELIFGSAVTGYPSFVGPGVPKARVEAIRAAYSATMQDPEFRKVVEKQQLELDPISGEDLTKIIQRLYSAPPAVIERARKLIPRS
jgi:tripartite-type tricarboxylate transporter receptor subunit TctC